jgi:hypothetical protein
MKKPKLPKKGAGRRLSERLTNLSKQPPPQSLVDKINADQDGATKEQKAQDWVVANVDSAPDTPSFEEVWIAGYEQGDRDAVERSMTHIEKQGVALANLEHKLLMKTTKGEAENARLRGALEEIAKSSSGCECCTEGALNREELGDVARWVLAALGDR